MITKIVFGALIGGIIGASLGHLGKCKGGGCPIACTPQGGMLFGAMLGIMILMVLPPRTPGVGGGGVANFTPSEHVVHITESADLEKALAENDVVLVDFYADWCGPCQKLKPTIHALADAYVGRAAVAVVNVDEVKELARESGVRSIPDVRVFKGGKEQERFVGARSEADIAAILERLLAE